VGHLVIEGDQVGQAGPAFHEPILAGPDPLDGMKGVSHKELRHVGKMEPAEFQSISL